MLDTGIGLEDGVERHAAASQVQRGSYIPEIDGLRAIAVAAVMLYHLNPSLMPGGFTGVDVFFVISGYVVSASLKRDVGLSFPSMLANFYARRIVRIFPPLLVCLLVSTALTVMFIPTIWFSGGSESTGLAAFFGVSNIALLLEDSYFSPRPEMNPFTQTWSVSLEEQFYLFFPSVFYAWAKFRNSRIRMATGLMTAGLSLLSVGFMYRIDGIDQAACFYLLPSRFWELGAGAILFQLQCGGAARLLAVSRTSYALAAGSGLVLLAAIAADSRQFPLPWALVPVLGALLIVSAVTAPQPSNAVVARLLRSSGMVFVGKISYPLYLWHWPIDTLFRWTIGLGGPFLSIVASGLAFLFACLSHYYLEQPSRFVRWARARQAPVVVSVGLPTIVLSSLIAAAAFAHSDQLSLSVVMQHREQWLVDVDLPRAAIAGCTVDWIEERFAGAHLKYAHRHCADPTPPRRLFVVGDSHALAYHGMLSLLVGQQGLDVWLYSKPGCAFAVLIRPVTPECATLTRSIIGDIASRAIPGDVVFLPALRLFRFDDPLRPLDTTGSGYAAASDPPAADRRIAFDQAVAVIDELRKIGLHVVIEAPKPLFKASAFQCADWFNRMDARCDGTLVIDRAELLAYRQPVMDSLAALATHFPDLVVWDPFPVLCPEDPCRAIADTGPLFFDTDHLSNFGNAVLYPDFLSVLQHIWAGDG